MYWTWARLWKHCIKQRTDTDSTDCSAELSRFYCLMIIKSKFWHQNPKTSRVILLERAEATTFGAQRGAGKEQRVEDHFVLAWRTTSIVATKQYGREFFCLYNFFAYIIDVVCQSAGGGIDTRKCSSKFIEQKEKGFWFQKKNCIHIFGIMLGRPW